MHKQIGKNKLAHTQEMFLYCQRSNQEHKRKKLKILFHINASRNQRNCLRLAHTLHFCENNLVEFVDYLMGLFPWENTVFGSYFLDFFTIFFHWKPHDATTMTIHGLPLAFCWMLLDYIYKYVILYDGDDGLFIVTHTKVRDRNPKLLILLIDYHNTENDFNFLRSQYEHRSQTHKKSPGRLKK